MREVTDQTAGSLGPGEPSLDQVRESSGLHLHWHGRRSYRSAIPTPRVLEPDDTHSYGDVDSGNLVIEGDNLQVMVSLQSQFSDAVDVVYIDPPYNRGGEDFRYSDARFQDPNADASDAYYVSNEDGGRHTKWLNYMAPRLVAIHRLMADHGVLFVSISDVELGRLIMLLDEIFDGEKNRVAIITWRGSADNNPSRVIVEHEYILVYAKNIRKLPKVWTTPADETRDMLIEEYKRVAAEFTDPGVIAGEWRSIIRANQGAVGRLGRYTEVDSERGPYQAAYRVHNTKRGGYRYGVTESGVVEFDHPRSYKLPLNGYRFKPATMQQLIDDGRIVFPRRRDQIVQMKDYLEDYRGTLRSVIDLDARSGSYRLKELFGEDFEGFKNPKPVELIELLIGAASNRDSLIFDPFAGSGTTGDAVLQLNRVDGGDRRFILIEEGNGTDLYAKTLTAPRIRRAIEIDSLSTGFRFLRAGRELDREAILGLEREKIVSVICQTDRTGTKSGIRRLSGRQWLIGVNSRSEPLALVWNGVTDSKVTVGIINEALAEAASLNLKTPLRIYGTTCTVSETRSFIFCQIPDEILASLISPELEPSDEDVDRS